MSPLIPYRAIHFSKRDRRSFFVLGLATIYEGLVITLSLGFLTVDTRLAWLLHEHNDED